MTAIGVEPLPASEVSPDEPVGTSTGRTARMVIAAVLLVVVAVAVFASGLFRHEDHLAEARAVVRDDARFATATDAGAAFTRVSSLLQSAGEECLDEGRPPSCDHLFVAAGYSRVSAVSLLTCTRRGIAQARAALLEHLEAIERRPAAPLPATPRCSI